ncbi:MAG: potassium channel family protein [Saprospiraceae bacterium]|nr:potassium channel family protein [Saprospiraceae bacterium]
MFFIRTVLTFFKDKQYRDLIFTSAVIIGMGTVSYHYLEGLSWFDSAYFSVITLSTVGYGDFSPQTTGGKIFTMFYVIIGIGIILSFVNAFYAHYAKVLEESSLKRTLKKKNKSK